MPLRDRPTTELVILMLTAMVAGTVLIATAGLFLLTLYQPDRDTSGIGASLSDLVGVATGGILGYLAGRRYEQNK